jgi:hypothetical protein
MRRYLLPVLVLAAPLALPALASASELKVASGTLFYADSNPAARNVVTITLSTDGRTLTVTDSGRVGTAQINVASDGTCTGGRATGRCPAAGVTVVDVQTFAQNDTITVNAPIPGRLSGGDGNDTLAGGPADGDFLRGDGGADTMTGKGGRDTVDYSDRTAPVTVSLDGAANDGEAGENDLVGDDVEVVNGGAAADTLTGSPRDDFLFGNGGDDVLNGGAGTDVMVGGDGTDRVTYESSAAGVRVTLDGQPNDGAPGENENVDAEVVTGSPGDDVLIGNAGANALQGIAGNDRLLGGAGADGLDAGPGDDVVEALDGVTDQIVCGEGLDGVVSDRQDARTDCESLKYRVLSATGTAVHVTRGKLAIPVRCSPASAAGCHGRATLRYGARTLARRNFTLTPGRRWRAKFTLSKRSRGLVARRRLIRVALIVRNRDAAGVVTTTRQTIRLRA